MKSNISKKKLATIMIALALVLAGTFSAVKAFATDDDVAESSTQATNASAVVPYDLTKTPDTSGVIYDDISWENTQPITAKQTADTSEADEGLPANEPFDLEVAPDTSDTVYDDISWENLQPIAP